MCVREHIEERRGVCVSIARVLSGVLQRVRVFVFGFVECEEQVAHRRERVCACVCARAWGHTH